MESTGLERRFLVFDVESVGLHGEGFAVGWVVIDAAGTEYASGSAACQLDAAAGDEEGRAWVRANTPNLVATHASPREVRAAFWAEWRRWADAGAVLVGDCTWPVEARFLAACVDDDPETRRWQGPYPLHDVASLLLAVGLDPLATHPRAPDELPQHAPLPDARQSARMLVRCLRPPVMRVPAVP